MLPDGGVSELWDRTLGFQLGRDSPFSIWGQEHWLDPAQDVGHRRCRGARAAVGVCPAGEVALQARALGAAVLLALQLALSHWFYLYVVWWFPLAFAALLAREPEAAR